MELRQRIPSPCFRMFHTETVTAGRRQSPIETVNAKVFFMSVIGLAIGIGATATPSAAPLRFTRSRGRKQFPEVVMGQF